MKENITAILVVIVIFLGIGHIFAFLNNSRLEKEYSDAVKNLIKVPHLDCPKTTTDVYKIFINGAQPYFENKKPLHQVGVALSGNLTKYPEITVKNYCLYSTDTNLLVGELY